MSRIERKCCLISTSQGIWQGYLTFSYYFMFDRIVCVLVTFFPMRTFCDGHHEELESH